MRTVDNMQYTGYGDHTCVVQGFDNRGQYLWSSIQSTGRRRGPCLNPKMQQPQVNHGKERFTGGGEVDGEGAECQPKVSIVNTHDLDSHAHRTIPEV